MHKYRKAQEQGEYEAFGGKDRMESVEFRPAKEPWSFSEYVYLMDVTYDGEFGTRIVISFTYAMVVIKGRNLQALVTGLRRKTIDFIQEFTAERWEKPRDPKTPIVESMEFITQDIGASLGEARKNSSAG